ncbi:MAG: hypothetical protein FI734_05940 [SAR202 cluster bacterium]|nr:hypothetical protein [SAR202 cluster bacterium]|tara:strand:- start:2650 stop:3009 length:360 start_codon:yes stop_codon:yes gene_type:complete
MAGKNSKSRAAAGQAKAKERARKKLRGTGTSIASSAYAAASSAKEVEPSAGTINELADAPSPVSAQPATLSNNRPTRQAAAITIAASSGLRKEIALIGSMTIVVSAIMIVLRLYTDLGN